MYIRKLYIAVWAINFALVGMCGYIWGYHKGVSIEFVDQQSIDQAVFMALMAD